MLRQEHMDGAVAVTPSIVVAAPVDTAGFAAESRADRLSPCLN
jgi:hypothetical protein